jgi:hypothetical protein
MKNLTAMSKMKFSQGKDITCVNVQNLLLFRISRMLKCKLLRVLVLILLISKKMS